jgi:hypothetical protein
MSREHTIDAPLRSLYPEERCWLDRTELWPDHVRLCKAKPGTGQRLGFGEYLTKASGFADIEFVICREIAGRVDEQAVEPAAWPRLRFWRQLDPAKVPVFSRELPRVLPYRPRRAMLHFGPVGLRWVDDQPPGITCRLDNLFFDGPPYIFPEMPVELRRELRAAISNAAGLAPSQGFPLLDYDRLQGEIPLGNGRSFEFERRTVRAWGEPTDDPFDRDLHTYSSEAYLLRLMREPPATPDPAEPILRAAVLPEPQP